MTIMTGIGCCVGGSCVLPSPEKRRRRRRRAVKRRGTALVTRESKGSSDAALQAADGARPPARVPSPD